MGERVIHGSRSSVHLKLGPASSRRPLFFDGPAAEVWKNFLTPVNHIEGCRRRDACPKRKSGYHPNTRSRRQF